MQAFSTFPHALMMFDTPCLYSPSSCPREHESYANLRANVPPVKGGVTHCWASMAMSSGLHPVVLIRAQKTDADFLKNAKLSGAVISFVLRSGMGIYS